MSSNDQPPETPAFGGDHAVSYAERAPKSVPGFADLHRMTSQLLAENVTSKGRVLVLGAGGGLELKALANAHPGWSFDGVDPSADMLRAAEQTVGPQISRMSLHHGYIDAAPAGPFDGAVCLLTMHFVPRDQRLETLNQVHQRLKQGAPFAVAHISFPQTEPERTRWIARHVIFGGTDPANLEAAQQAIASKLTILSPEQEVAMLGEAGFSDITLFYAGLSFKGWICTA